MEIDYIGSLDNNHSPGEIDEGKSRLPTLLNKQILNNQMIIMNVLANMTRLECDNNKLKDAFDKTDKIIRSIE